MRSLLILCAFSCSALIQADEMQTGGFSSEMLELGQEQIHIISAFKDVTYFTTYSYAGDPVWEIPFNSEILSWKVKGEQLFIFSKARNGLACFLTCVESGSGKLVWERAIVAPAAN